MAILAAILPLVSQSSALALVLYRLAAADQYAAKELFNTAKAISDLALIVKEVGTIIKEDDRLPSVEAFEAIEDILSQCRAILNEIDLLVSHPSEEEPDGHEGNARERNHVPTLTPELAARFHYLKAHLHSLRATLSVMLQTLHTAQSIIWARVRPTVSPKQCANAVANEKLQLESLIIDQQMAILLASKLYEGARPDARLLMEQDSSLSLGIINEVPKPSDLTRYQDKFISSLDTQRSGEESWLGPVCGVSKSQLDRLLDRWTTLQQFEEDQLDAERRIQAQRRETQQPFVESDSEEEAEALPKFASSGVGLRSPVPRKPDTIPSPFSESHSLPIPTSTPGQHPASAPSSPRANSTLPVQAAAAMKAKDNDDELDLEIPWTLRTRKYHWKYVDGKVQESNTHLPSSEAFTHRHSWTEIQASWVCKETLKEAGYSYTQVQKAIPDGRRTKFETWFCIDQPLTFDQVQRLVERTVELYCKTQPPSPPLPEKHQARRSSFEHRYAPPTAPRSKAPPPLGRSATVYHIPQRPSLDRATSSPGLAQAQAQAPPQPPGYSSNPRPSNLQIPPQSWPLPHSAPYPSNILPQPYPASPRTFAQSPPYQQPPRHIQPPVYVQSPLRTSLEGTRHDHYYSSTSGTSDSESVARSRRQKERSRRRGGDSGRDGGKDGGKRRSKHGHGKAGALMGVAGLTALLDGLVGI